MNRICDQCGKVAKYTIKDLNPESKFIFSLYYCDKCIDIIFHGPNDVVVEL